MKNPPNIQAICVIETGVMELIWSTGETLNVNLSICQGAMQPLPSWPPPHSLQKLNVMIMVTALAGFVALTWMLTSFMS